MARPLRSSVVGAAVDAYDGHVGRYGPELAREMVRVTAARGGQRALDVGCGTGALTIALAEVLGGGSVAGIDPSERFVAACRALPPDSDGLVCARHSPGRIAARPQARAARFRRIASASDGTPRATAQDEKE